MRVPRMTTRRWMTVVLVTAGLAGSYIHARPWFVYATAVRAEQVYRRYYDEGRLTEDRYFEVSERLMQAELALSGTEAERSAACMGHLNRSVWVRECERRDSETACSRAGDTYYLEAAAYVENLRARLGMPKPAVTDP